MPAVDMVAVPFSALRRGAMAALPLQLATAPFGLIFGALATQAGLDLPQAMAMTVVVVAGAAQLAAVQLMAEHAPAWLAIATGAVVNLRLAMYSASIAPYWQGATLRTRALSAFLLHDQAYALSMRRYAEAPEEGTAARLGFFLGVGVISLVAWTAGSLAGALLGARLPEAWALEFAVPITFIAVLAPLLRDAAHVAAAVTASAAALASAPLPLGSGLIVAAAAGIAVGATVEGMLARRGAR
jgi:predicted branched-subunit amino acid permease